MGRFHLNKLPKEKRIQMIAEFYDVIASLRNREEVRLFFKDLLNADEIATFMRRIEVATLLLSGYTYEQIAELLGVGRGKVTNVQKVLAKGGEGYKLVIKRLLEVRKRRLKIQRKRTKALLSDFERLKQRYPLYFLLFNLIDEISEALQDDKSLDKEALISTPSRKSANSTTD
jgi:TrpR-related protein YerC/YecD